VWLLYPKKISAKRRILYNDAVEAALCFGWIDSIVRRYDDLHTMQRFTPRKTGSAYSQPNIERLRALTDEGLIHPTLKASVAEVIAREFVFPADIIAALRRNNEAWQYYRRCSPAYQRIRIAYIDSARTREEEFQKRLTHFITQCRKGRMIRGYGGIEKYY